MIPPSVFQKTLRGFLAPVITHMDDPAVSEIMINGPTEIYVERGGRIQDTDARFASADDLMSALRVIAQYVGRPFDALHPILEARLPDGSRVEAVLDPIAANGPAMAIRKFSEERLTVSKLLEFGALTMDAARTLRALVEAKRNIVVAGGTGSGKTSLLNALSAFIPKGERIIVIEDARELQLQQAHVVPMETRPADSKGRGAITIRHLFKASLRMRPDRIVIGEIRGEEALDLIQAMTSGHGGCLSTVHATYPIDTLNRLETMALMSGVELPLTALRSQIASAIDIVVQTARFRDGQRGITHITEVCGTDAQHGYRLKDLFLRCFRPQGGTGSEVASDLLPTGVIPQCLEAIRSAGLDIPPAVYAAARAARGGGDTLGLTP